VHLTKHHGLGNDFLIVLDEANERPVAPDADLARRLCDRHTGLGADGLIHGARPDPSAAHDVVFRLWNSDGSEAEVSGNGVRCLAHAVVRQRGAASGSVRVSTPAGVRHAEVDAAQGATADVEVEMGPIGPGPTLSDRAAAQLTSKATTASVGNPHLIVLVDDPAAVDLAVTGLALEAEFAGGINVEFIAPVGDDTVDLVVWERGAGITQACGSGATAAAHVAHEWGLVGETVQVRMPGGTATVRLTPEGAYLRGPSTFVAAIEVPDA
jgi:diaminopimelate epimerase